MNEIAVHFLRQQLRKTITGGTKLVMISLMDNKQARRQEVRIPMGQKCFAKIVDSTE